MKNTQEEIDNDIAERLAYIEEMAPFYNAELIRIKNEKAAMRAALTKIDHSIIKQLIKDDCANLPRGERSAFRTELQIVHSKASRARITAIVNEFEEVEKSKIKGLRDELRRVRIINHTLANYYANREHRIAYSKSRNKA